MYSIEEEVKIHLNVEGKGGAVPYGIISGSHTRELELRVKFAIRCGYIPQGGIAIQGTHLYQAVVKQDQLDYNDK